MPPEIYKQYQRRNKSQNIEMAEQKLDALITLLTEMMTQRKETNQGTPTKNEVFSRHTPSLQIMESLFTPKHIQRNEQEEANMDEVLQEYVYKFDTFTTTIPFYTYWEAHKRKIWKFPKPSNIRKPKVPLPTFDGSDKMSARAWLQKL